MEIYLVRHAQTEGNLQKKYIGVTNQPICEIGVKTAENKQISFVPEHLYTTALLRTQQTANILFNGRTAVVIEGLGEMNFGEFENKSFAELESDANYSAWLDGNCETSVYDGESKEGFCNRVCKALLAEIEHLISINAKSAAFVVHGGTIRAIMACLTDEEKDYFDWEVDNCAVFHCEFDEQKFADDKKLRLVEII